MDHWFIGSMDRSFSGLMDPWFNGSIMNRWFHGSVVRRIIGLVVSMVCWFGGWMDHWFDGLLDRWFDGSMKIGSMDR